MKVGDKIRINEPGASYHGTLCTIIAVNEDSLYPYQARTRHGAFWFPERELIAQPETRPDNDRPANSGLGISGLGRHVEPVTVPTIASLKRHERQAARATTCRRCKQNDVFDGAMFTTDPASGLCDDCV